MLLPLVRTGFLFIFGRRLTLSLYSWCREQGFRVGNTTFLQYRGTTPPKSFVEFSHPFVHFTTLIYYTTFQQYRSTTPPMSFVVHFTTLIYCTTFLQYRGTTPSMSFVEFFLTFVHFSTLIYYTTILLNNTEALHTP